MNLIIKKASEQDIFSIHQIVQEAFEKYARDLGLPEKVSALKETPHTIKEELYKKQYLLLI